MDRWRGCARFRVLVCAFAAYGLLAIGQSWPLPVHFSTHFTGDPGGDTGAYIWNLWIFRHELIETRTTPFSTLAVLPLDGPTDLSLHNYTVFSDLLALPLLPWLGIVRTFNLVYLLNVALVGFATFLLVDRLTKRPLESFLAGVVFMWSPFLVTRGSSHFSLVAAAPLPIFVLTLYRALDSQRLRDAAALGLIVSWAAFCDPYYAVYCLILGAGICASRWWAVIIVNRPGHQFGRAKRVLTWVIAVGLLLIVSVHGFGGGHLSLGLLNLSMRTIYTPVLIVTVLMAVRLWLAKTIQVRRIAWPSRQWLTRFGIVTGVSAVVLTMPMVSALAVRMTTGDLAAAPVLWRSGAPGVDLLAFFIPNPNHPLMPAWIVQWLARGPGGYEEQVASLSFVGLALVLAARRFAGFKAPRSWLVITVVFALMALGPFVTIGRLTTSIPTPWTILRYLPIVGAARMPARFDAVVSLGFAVLIGTALVALTNRFPALRSRILFVAALGLAIELAPIPRTLYPADVPKVYQVVAADPRPIRVLKLPSGVQDGLKTTGVFGAQTEYYQTFHGKGLVGGYLSRIDPSTRRFHEEEPVLKAVYRLSEGQSLDPGHVTAAREDVDSFLKRTNVGYVVWKNSEASTELRTFATALFGLKKIFEADGYELYIPRDVK